MFNCTSDYTHRHPIFLSFPFYYSYPPLVFAQVTGLMGAFLTEDASGMASDVAASRKRPSPSCEAGQLTILRILEAQPRC